jgi:hypothetical protein
MLGLRMNELEALLKEGLSSVADSVGVAEFGSVAVVVVMPSHPQWGSWVDFLRQRESSPEHSTAALEQLLLEKGVTT